MKNKLAFFLHNLECKPSLETFNKTLQSVNATFLIYLVINSLMQMVLRPRKPIVKQPEKDPKLLSRTFACSLTAAVVVVPFSEEKYL